MKIDSQAFMKTSSLSSPHLTFWLQESWLLDAGRNEIDAGMKMGGTRRRSAEDSQK